MTAIDATAKPSRTRAAPLNPNPVPRLTKEQYEGVQEIVSKHVEELELALSQVPAALQKSVSQSISTWKKTKTHYDHIVENWGRAAANTKGTSTTRADDTTATEDSSEQENNNDDGYVQDEAVNG